MTNQASLGVAPQHAAILLPSSQQLHRRLCRRLLRRKEAKRPQHFGEKLCKAEALRLASIQRRREAAAKYVVRRKFMDEPTSGLLTVAICTLTHKGFV